METGKAEEVLTVQLLITYIYCMYRLCALHTHTHIPLSLSDKLIKGKGDERVS